MIRNLLQGNLQKYQMMNIRSKRASNEQTSITVKGEIITESENLKLLGVTIDSRLNFNEHINNVCMKVSQRISVLMRLRNLIPTMAKLQLYKSAILPNLTYCHIVWHQFCRASDTRRLERLQERGLRAVFRDIHLNYQQLLDKANLPTLCNRRLQDICILMYKVKHNLCPTPICNLFQPSSNHTYQLRQTDFALPRFNTTTYGKPDSLRYLGPKLWHNLSRKERLASNLNTFKSQIRKRALSSLLKDGCTGCHLCNS